MRALVAMLAVGLLAAACTSSPATRPDGPSPRPPDHARLVAKAALDPCPASGSRHVAHGLPNLTLPCLGTGPRVNLAGLAGVPTVINIWGSWCAPCQAEAPFLSQVYDALKGRVRFLGIDTEDDPDSALDFAAHVSPPMHYPSVVDDQKKAIVALNLVSLLPNTVFVDASGRVVHTSLSQYKSVADLRRDISRYLGVR